MPQFVYVLPLALGPCLSCGRVREHSPMICHDNEHAPSRMRRMLCMHVACHRCCHAIIASIKPSTHIQHVTGFAILEPTRITVLTLSQMLRQ